MKLRSLSIVAFVFAVIAVAGWMWLGRNEGHRAIPNAPDHPGESNAAQKAPVGDVSAQIVPGTGPSDSIPKENMAPPPARTDTSVVPGMPMVRGTSVPPRPPAAVPARSGVGAPESHPDWQVQGTADLAKVQAMLRDFRTRMGANPVGSNAEIMKAVTGGNPVNARLGPPEGQELNAEGELVDRWGTPYFFHQMSKDKMEIRSAGPDRKMWTSDDLISK